MLNEVPLISLIKWTNWQVVLEIDGVSVLLYNSINGYSRLSISLRNTDDNHWIVCASEKILPSFVEHIHP